MAPTPETLVVGSCDYEGARMRAYLRDWARACAYFMADLLDQLAEWLQAGPPEPPHGGAA